jgi:hypothetical protein
MTGLAYRTDACRDGEACLSGPWFTAGCLRCDDKAGPFTQRADRDQWAIEHTLATGHPVRVEHGHSEQLVYVTVGNSDDKLTQARWSAFVTDVRKVLQASIDLGGEGRGGAWVGAWFSDPGAPYQNAIWAVEYIDAQGAGWAQAQLMLLAGEYDQDTIAWTYGVTTLLAPISGQPTGGGS